MGRTARRRWRPSSRCTSNVARTTRGTAAYARDVAERAVVRGAHREAAARPRRALAALETAADSDDRVRQMSVLAMSLGASLQATHGYAHPSVGEASSGAAGRGGAGPGRRRLLPSVVGLTSWHIARSDLAMAHELAERLVAMAAGAPIPGFVGLDAAGRDARDSEMATDARGITRLVSGRHAAARCGPGSGRRLQSGAVDLPAELPGDLSRLSRVALGLHGEVDRARDMDARCSSPSSAADKPYDRTAR